MQKNATHLCTTKQMFPSINKYNTSSTNISTGESHLKPPSLNYSVIFRVLTFTWVKDELKGPYGTDLVLRKEHSSLPMARCLVRGCLFRCHFVRLKTVYIDRCTHTYHLSWEGSHQLHPTGVPLIFQSAALP